jgi:hypothetical protein
MKLRLSAFLLLFLSLLVMTGCDLPVDPWEEEGYVVGPKPDNTTYLWCYNASALVTIDEDNGSALIEEVEKVITDLDDPNGIYVWAPSLLPRVSEDMYATPTEELVTKKLSRCAFEKTLTTQRNLYRDTGDGRWSIKTSLETFIMNSKLMRNTDVFENEYGNTNCQTEEVISDLEAAYFSKTRKFAPSPSDYKCNEIPDTKGYDYKLAELKAKTSGSD